MKIAVVTDDQKTISAHFGRAAEYAVITIENRVIIRRETRIKSNHQHVSLDDPHHEGHHHNHDHASMLAPITDCQILLARGMGIGAHNALKDRGIQTIITDIQEIDLAIQALIAGTLVDHPERLH
jgi:predicted Fe-Mo cluster-binding NifX family protein